MMRRAWVAALLVLVPAVLPAQSSQFGVRGLGLPGRPWTARTAGTAGAYGMFDPETALNPAAVAAISRLTAVITGQADFRDATNPAGSGSVRDNRFPFGMVGGQIPRSRFSMSVGYSSYTDRNFELGSVDSVELRGQTIAKYDTLKSLGGIGDIAGNVAYRLSNAIAVGFALHALTGSNRITATTILDDSTYTPIVQRTELSVISWGLSAGLTAQLGKRFYVSASVRKDATLDINVDSIDAYKLPLPWTLAGSLAYRPTDRLLVLGTVVSKNWSVTSDSLIAQGGYGAKNTLEVSGGIELRTGRTSNQFPVRAGVRYASIPWLIGVPEQPEAWSFAAGTGVSFSRGRGLVDVAVERVNRSAGPQYSEKAWLITVGVTVRP